VDEVLRNILFRLDRYAEALPHAQALIRHFGATSVRRAGNGMWNIGLILGGLGDYEPGVTLVSAGRRIDDEQGQAVDVADHLRLERFETMAREVLTADVYEDIARVGEALSIEEAIELALNYSMTDATGVAAGNDETVSQ